MSVKKPDDEKVSNVPPFGLRMLPDLKERISRDAAENNRSMNAEIIARLYDTIEEDNDPAKFLKVLLPADLRDAIIRRAALEKKNLDDYVRDVFTQFFSGASNDWDEIVELDAALTKQEIEAERERAAAADMIQSLTEMLQEHKTISAQKTALLNAVCYRVLQFKDALPEEATSLAKSILNAGGNDDGGFASEGSDIAEARYFSELRKAERPANEATDAKSASSRKRGQRAS